MVTVSGYAERQSSDGKSFYALILQGDMELVLWYAVADSRKICPAGWHVPSDAEWTVLTTFLGGENVAGGKLKVTGTEYWESPNILIERDLGITITVDLMICKKNITFGSEMLRVVQQCSVLSHRSRGH